MRFVSTASEALYRSRDLKIDAFSARLWPTKLSPEKAMAPTPSAARRETTTCEQGTSMGVLSALVGIPAPLALVAHDVMVNWGRLLCQRG